MKVSRLYIIINCLLFDSDWKGAKIVELITLNILMEEVIHRMPKQDETIY